ncbi:LysE family translocator [Pseudoxanthomonas daejeonensis]|nr:LysE family transporter [Pseudoxanthomonas daejeonensis]
MTALALLIFVSAITPGPNNLVLLHRGATRGFRAGLPASLGIAAGGSAMLAIALVVLGAGPLPQAAMPWLGSAGATMLLVMAMALWGAPAGDAPLRASPAGFWAMAAFQLANPKAWAFLASLAALRATSGGPSAAATVAIFAAASLLCSAIWLGGGRLMTRLLATPRRSRLFNRAMAVAMAAMAAHLLIRTWNP